LHWATAAAIDGLEKREFVKCVREGRDPGVVSIFVTPKAKGAALRDTLHGCLSGHLRPRFSFTRGAIVQRSSDERPKVEL
jgi:hypothetical protein